jgi:exosortase
MTNSIDNQVAPPREIPRSIFSQAPILWLLVAAVMLLPYVGIYLANLWRLPHYQFFPLLMAAVGYLFWERSRDCKPAPIGIVSAICLVVGTLAAIASALFASAWLGYTAFLFLIAAILHCLVERGTNDRMTPLVLPLVLIWQPPLSTSHTADGKLIQELQVISAHISSMWLDLLGFIHFRPGTVLQLPEKSFGVAEACSGVQSFFALLCFAALLVVFQRRRWLHALTLLGSSVFWAVLMNTVRITAIPIAFELFDLDLSEGTVHDILGYTTMGAALLLLVSTDQLLLTVLPRSKSSTAAPSAERTLANGKPSNLRYQWLAISVVVLLAPIFVLQAMDLYSSLGAQRKSIEFFQNDVFIAMDSNSAPRNLGNWKFIDYKREDRSRSADLGERSDVWRYQPQRGVAVVSFDQAFPGWHELSVCYQVSGWSLKSRQVVVPDDAKDWPAVAFELQRGPNDFAYVVFAMFNNARKPMEPPGTWGGLESLIQRARNRLSPTVRGSLFSLAGYQVQMFYSYQNGLSDAERSEILKQFALARQALLSAAGAP